MPLVERPAAARRAAGPARAEAVDPVRRELDEYFDGRRSLRPLVDLRGRAVQRRVLGELALVPFGETATYASSRRVPESEGGARGRDDDESQPGPDRAALPPRRRRRGSLVGYGGGLERKVELLRLEGAML